MRYTSRSRDRYKNLLALITGAATFGSVAATGVAMGLAAHQTALRDQRRQRADAITAARTDAARASRPGWVTVTPRARTVVHTRIVHRVSRAGAARVGAGGTVSAAGSSTTTSTGGSGPSAPTTTAIRPTRTPSPSPTPSPAPSPSPTPTSGS